MKYDMLIKNANIISMNQGMERYSWIGSKDGRITGVGKGAPDGDALQILDADGCTVLPGLTDCHTHVVNAGITLEAVPLENCRDIAEVLAALKRRCENDDNSWIYGANYVPQNVKENRYPTKKELNSICNGHNIAIFAATMHGVATNRTDIANVSDSVPGVVVLDGEQAGIYDSDESSFPAIGNILGSLSDDELWRFIKNCADHAKSKGATAIHGLFGMFVADDRDMELILERGKTLDIDIFPFWQTWDVQKAIDKGLPRVGGCLTLDGALFEYTMANYEPFVTAPALRGVLYHTDDEVYQVISKAHAAGLQCTLHAVGERAIDQLIWTYHRVFVEQGRKKLRHRIEHFCLPTDRQIQMAREMDLIISMQPGFTYLWDKKEGGEFEMILGRERADRWDPFNRIFDAGITVCGGSDCPVTALEPLVDIATVVNGDNPVRNTSMDNALKMYTTNAAYAVNNEKESGSLELGKLADMVMIDRDPYQCMHEEDIYEMQVLKTIKEGKIIYEAQ